MTLNRSLFSMLALVSSLVVFAGCASAPKASATADSAIAPAAVAAPVDKDVNAALMAGEFAWQDGRGASAAKHFARAAQLSSDPKIAEHAARVGLVSKQWELAEQSLKRWRELDPKAPGIAQTQAALAMQTGDVASAERMFRELLQVEPVANRKLVAQALMASPDKVAALETLNRLAVEPPLAGDVDTLLLMGQVAVQLKDDATAKRYGDLAVARFPAAASAYFWRGHLLLQSKDQGAAKADFAKALSLKPDNRDYRLTYAALLNELDDAAGAAKALAGGKQDDDSLAARAAYAARADDKTLMAQVYKELQELPEPRTDARLELLGQMAELLSLKKEAMDWYGEVGHGDHYMDAQLRLPVLLDDLGRHDEAIKQLDALRAAGIEDDQKLADSFLLEAELLTRKHDEVAAVAAYDRGLKALPDERRLLYGRALLFEKLDRVAEAERDLRRIVVLDPEDPDALNALGYTLADHNRQVDEALSLIEKALKLKPDEPAIVDSMGWVQYRKGNRTEAIKHLRHAYQLQPDAEIAAHLGEVLWVDGQHDAASSVWEEGKRKDAKNATLLDTMKRLQQ